MKIRVVDSVPGSGKTEAAIAFMNAHPDRKFLFVTPYLNEIDRIKRSCPGLLFEEPESDGPYSSKLTAFNTLLSHGRNIASTHALFAYYTDETRELLASGGYTLILDEVMNVIEKENLKQMDLEMLLKSGCIELEEDGIHVRWLRDDYHGRFNELKKKAKQRNLLMFENTILFWSLPAHSFSVFEEVFVLTYLFEAQMQCYYYRMHNLEFEYMGVDKTDKGYEFVDYASVPEYARRLIDKVHILYDEKANSIGKQPSALSSNWYNLDRKYGGEKVKKLSRAIYNVLHNKFRTSVRDAIWTTYKEQRNCVAHKRYNQCFVSCNARATNAYRDRHYLAYCVNIYFQPILKRYFISQGVEVHEDRYALSEMIQWVWRSAIRCGEEIWIYVPSSRMRGLLKGWLEELANAP